MASGSEQVKISTIAILVPSVVDGRADIMPLGAGGESAWTAEGCGTGGGSSRIVLM
jgi:hypothetical protein